VPKREPKLTPKQARFVRELMVDENAKQAAIRAGYSPHCAETNGPRLCRQPAIRAAIEAARKEVAGRTELRQEEVIAELKRVAFSQPKRLLDKDGKPIPIHLLPDADAAAVASFEVEVEETPQRRTDDGLDIPARARASVKKWKLWDKPKALELAMKHLGMLDKKSEDGDGEGVQVNINLVAETKERGHVG
jgi:phage terminase small subunit